MPDNTLIPRDTGDTLERIRRLSPGLLMASWQVELDGEIHNVVLARDGPTLNTVLGGDGDGKGSSGLLPVVVEQSLSAVPYGFTWDGVAISFGTGSNVWVPTTKPLAAPFDLAARSSTLTIRVAVEARSTWLRRLFGTAFRRATVKRDAGWAAAGLVPVFWHVYELIVEGASQGTWVLTSGRRYGPLRTFVTPGGAVLSWWTFVTPGGPLPPGV
jgi:hypothetical protein